MILRGYGTRSRSVRFSPLSFSLRVSGNTFYSLTLSDKPQILLALSKFRRVFSNLSEITLRPRYSAPPYSSQDIPPFFLFSPCRRREFFLVAHEASIGWASASRAISHHTHCFWDKGTADIGISLTHIVAGLISKSAHANFGEAGASWVRGANGSTGGRTFEKCGLFGWVVAFGGCHDGVREDGIERATLSWFTNDVRFSR